VSLRLRSVVTLQHSPLSYPQILVVHHDSDMTDGLPSIASGQVVKFPVDGTQQCHWLQVEKTRSTDTTSRTRKRGGNRDDIDLENAPGAGLSAYLLLSCYLTNLIKLL
jgi:hypothetical protein